MADLVWCKVAVCWTAYAVTIGLMLWMQRRREQELEEEMRRMRRMRQRNVYQELVERLAAERDEEERRRSLRWRTS